MNLIEFPELIQIEILSHFNLNEKSNLKLVCKSWKKLIDSHNMKNVCIHEFLNPYDEKWPMSDKMIKYKETLKINNPKDSHYKIDIGENCLKKIEKLLIYSVRYFFNSKAFNCLSDLRVLYLDCSLLLQLSPQVDFDFPKLEILSIKSSRLGKFRLNSPNLKKFIYWNLYDFQYGWLEQEIEICFELKNLTYIEFNYFNLSHLKIENLEYLICQKVKFPFDLNNYPKLKKFELWPIESEINELKIIEEQYNKLNSPNLKFIVSGFENQRKTFEKKVRSDRLSRVIAYTLSNEDLKFFAKNYSKLCKQIPWFIQLNYSNFIENFKNLPKNFFYFFSNILYVRVDKYENELILFDFLQKSQLKGLILSCIFSQNFYDKLPLIKSIKCLQIESCSKIDLNFISNFNSLISLSVFEEEFEENISIDLIYRIFKSNQHLTSLSVDKIAMINRNNEIYTLGKIEINNKNYDMLSEEKGYYTYYLDSEALYNNFGDLILDLKNKTENSI